MVKVTKSNKGRRKVRREEVIEVLANPEFTTQEQQAAALHITRVHLWRLRCQDSTIDEEVLRLVRERSAVTMAAGLRRLHRIIEGGNEFAAINAMHFLAKYRGEFIEKRELSGDVTYRWADEDDDG